MYELNIDLFKIKTPCWIVSRIYEENEYMYQTLTCVHYVCADFKEMYKENKNVFVCNGLSLATCFSFLLKFE